MVWLDRPELVVLPDFSLNFVNCPFNILFKFYILLCRVGTHLASEPHLGFQKMRRTSLFFWKVSLYAHEAFQMPLESLSNFSKANRVLTLFSKAARELLYIHPTNRKKSTANPWKNSANREKEYIRWFSHIFWKLKWNSIAISVPYKRILKMNKILKGHLQN